MTLFALMVARSSLIWVCGDLQARWDWVPVPGEGGVRLVKVLKGRESLLGC